MQVTDEQARAADALREARETFWRDPTLETFEAKNRAWDEIRRAAGGDHETLVRMLERAGAIPKPR